MSFILQPWQLLLVILAGWVIANALTPAEFRKQEKRVNESR